MLFPTNHAAQWIYWDGEDRILLRSRNLGWHGLDHSFIQYFKFFSTHFLNSMLSNECDRELIKFKLGGIYIDNKNGSFHLKILKLYSEASSHKDLLSKKNQQIEVHEKIMIDSTEDDYGRTINITIIPVPTLFDSDYYSYNSEEFYLKVKDSIFWDNI